MLVRIGLGRDYSEEESLLRGIRGRIDFGESLQRLAFQQGQAHCHYETYSPNVLKNQVVRSTLARLAQVGNFGPIGSQSKKLRRNIRRTVREMEAVDLIELKPDHIRREQMQRHDHDYRLMLNICSLIMSGEMPTESEGSAYLQRLDRDAMTLYRVFEEFVARFYRLRLHDWKVSSQRQLLWPAGVTSEFLPIMKPDLTLQHRSTSQLVVLDTKFTAKSLTSGQYDNLTFSRDHIFQIYAYLRSQEHHSIQHAQATGILLYPAANYNLNETITVQGHQIYWKCIDLAQPWERIEANLLDLMNDID